MDETAVREIVKKLLAERPAATGQRPVPMEVSARHVHLSEEHIESLFGHGCSLTPARELSMPGQYLSEQRVKLVSGHGEFSGVAVLGPARGRTQIEISSSDARVLGLSPPVRLSGDLDDAADVLIVAGDRFVHACGSVIIARNHIHMRPGDAEKYGVKDMETVKVAVEGLRPIIFTKVVVRVSPTYTLQMHIDVDEANVCGYTKNLTGQIIKRRCID